MNTTLKSQGRINCIFLLVIAFMLVVGGCSDRDEQQMMQSARAYLEKQDLRAASIELRNVLQQNPDNGEAHYTLGQVYLTYGDYALAEKEYRRAANSGWKQEGMQLGIAEALLSQGKFRLLLDSVTVEDSYSASTRAGLLAYRGAAEAGLKSIDLAKKTLAEAAAIQPDAFQVLKTRIQLQLAEGDAKAARGTLESALDLYPEKAGLQLLKATVSVRDKNHVAARAALQKVIDLEPPNIMTRSGRSARVWMMRLDILDKELEKAENSLAFLLKRNADDPEANYLGAVLAFEQRQYDLAEQRAHKVLKLLQDHHLSKLMLGKVKYAQGNYEQASYYLSKYVAAAQADPEAVKLLAQSYMKTGQHGEAQSILLPALKEKSDDPELLALLGISELQSGAVDSGIKELEKAVEAAPNSGWLRGELAKAYIVSGETDKAIQELQGALKQGDERGQAEVLLVRAYLRAGDFGQATDMVLGMLARKPGDPGVLVLTGNVYAAGNERQEARKYFRQALESSPGFVPAAVGLARLEQLDGELAKAAELYKGIIDTSPDSAPMVALARLAEQRGQTQEMIDWLQQAQQRWPNEITPRVLLIKYYLHQRRFEKVHQLVEKAIKVAPGQPLVLFLQGRAFMVQRRYEEALTPFKELISREPESLAAKVLLSEAFLLLDRPGDAREQLQIALQKRPQYLPALSLMAEAEIRSGHPDKALGLARQVQQIKPELPVGFELAGDALMSRQDFAAARAAYKQAWDIQRSVKLAIKLSEAVNRSGDPESANEPLLAWLSEHPDDASARQYLGGAYQRMGQHDKAIKEYEKLLSVQQDNVVALNNLAWIYMRADDPRALEYAERAHQAGSGDPSIQDTYGWVLVRQGQIEKGSRLLKQAADSLPDIPEVRYHYAVALIEAGEKKRGRQMLEQVLREGGRFEGREHAEKLIKQ